MLKTHDRAKLINAIIYFAANTKHCGKTKLFKLLFLLDFEHFKQTGRSVTGVEYYAFPKGPVPGDLYEELGDEPSQDFEEALEIKGESIIDLVRYTFVPKRDFDEGLFSKREIRLLESIATEYRDKFSKQMVEITHAENGVWDRVYADGAGKFQPIPYELAVEGENAAMILEKSKEFAAIKCHFGN